MDNLTNFINGEHVSPLKGQYLDNVNPAKGEVYSKVADSDSEDLAMAVAAAKRSYAHWQTVGYKERAQILNKIADLIDENSESLARAESIDQGKPYWLAKSLDIPRASENFRYFANLILQNTELATAMDSHGVNYVHRKPVGVVGLISPWNLPLYLLTWKIAPALAAGNCVVCKPSELTSKTAHMLGPIMKSAGLPDGVCNIILGLGGKVGAALVSHPDVPAISFTGGTVTARAIIEGSAPYYKKLSLELGGKNPNIIFADCDLDKCIETTLRSSFLNQGEICLCGSRILVEEKIYAEFIDKFVQKVSELKVGDPLDKSSFMGALVSEAHLKKVEGFIERAKKEGGKILTGGVRPDLPLEFQNGYFLRPTVIAGLDSRCEAMQEEIFGPVVTVSSFSTDEEALRLANDTRYGLSASVWTSNINRAHTFSQKLDVGQVWVNAWMKRDLRVPFGGVKFSGVGREGGVDSLDFYTEKQNICISLN
ncbi:MAG: aldehyde dehydrogenase [Bdellovibrionales bacterium]|nr:aldehyde dehydrogenase [Bdellovibrionales bacterium]